VRKELRHFIFAPVAQRMSPLQGDSKRIKLSIELLTDQEFDQHGLGHDLDSVTWYERRQRLEELGGPPLQ
jgi:hypothetical protein